MSAPRLMAVVAHPDDEALGFGGTWRSTRPRASRCSCSAATRGDAGRYRGHLPGE